ncbi:hypothetical protein AVDCRST_MAG84-6773 [uncultured Microcoleus sp.]|uniref:Uncharacterized protein n=1 Tax=uncultured Microcoleus sp. TaxID=259945 RepID=A0A6J4PEZ1_9CYAN|nr:hypothetical protein AVDCRST_MAG84-6773 [uncultured Microcoleus sp.]
MCSHSVFLTVRKPKLHVSLQRVLKEISSLLSGIITTNFNFV